MTSLSRRTFLGAAAVGSLGTVAGSAAAQPEPSGWPITADGAWCWFGDPRAVHFEGEHNRTYIGWINTRGEIAIGQYDHTTDTLTKTVLMADFPVDDHNNPTICIRPGNRVAVFWTAHASADHQRIYYRRSAAPEDISEWEPLKWFDKNTPGGSSFTYENLVQLSTEPSRLYMFWRGGNFNPNYTSTTGGDIWADPKTLVYVAGQRPYLKVHSNNVDRIDFAFTDGHPRDVHTSIFHMYYQTGNLYHTDGSLIGPMGAEVDGQPAMPPSAATTVYDSTNRPKAWVHDVALGADGHPVIVFATFPGDPEWTGHRYHYARWTGNRWDVQRLCDAGGTIYELPSDGSPPSEPDYSGGITLDHSNPSEVLLSRQPSGGMHKIERWVTPDKGATWNVQPIAQDLTEKNVRPFKPHGLTGHGPMSILWMAGRYTTFTDFGTRIMAVGADGTPFRLA